MSVLPSFTEQYKNAKNEKDRERAEKQLLAYFETEEYRKLPYQERNSGWITSHKLKSYNECPLFAYWRYVLGKTTPYDEEKDYFIIGQAIDDRITIGDDYYTKNYVTVARRGTKETDALEASGMTLLTNTQTKQIDSMFEEFGQNPYFPKQPTKHHLIWLAFDKYPCKAELDHFDLTAGIFGDFKTATTLPALHERLTKGDYDVQFAFYFSGILEKFGQRMDCEIYGMDKHTWARSHTWIMRANYLQEKQALINTLIASWAESEESGIWEAPNLQTMDGLKILWDSPFYKEYEARYASPTIL